MTEKLTYPAFREALRKHGEYSNAMLMGLYARYLAGDIAPCVAAVLTPKTAKKPEQVARRISPLSESVLTERQRKYEEKRLARKQKILQMLSRKAPMDAYQIALELGIVPEYAMQILRQLKAEKLVLVRKASMARGGAKNMYSLSEKASLEAS
ncbi:MAG: hypothetical protein VXW65_14545 [Pseudomonadota bacterium]|nr:hypothetical protein [Pseudomonadota bacterium]